MSVSCRSVSAMMSCSPTRMRPEITARRRGSSLISARMVTDLPEPDSPMMHSTSPGFMPKDTPLTACTVASRLTNFTRKSSTATIARQVASRASVLSSWVSSRAQSKLHVEFFQVVGLGLCRRDPLLHERHGQYGAAVAGALRIELHVVG